MNKLSNLTIHAMRLKPGTDLLKKLATLVKERNIRAGFIISCCGSLTRAALRLASRNETTIYEGKFEIVSLVGTLCQDGLHLHVAISDPDGKTIGGHLMEGCRIYTTAEIVIGETNGYLFSREEDIETGYPELNIQSVN